MNKKLLSFHQSNQRNPFFLIKTNKKSLKYKLDKINAGEKDNVFNSSR